MSVLFHSLTTIVASAENERSHGNAFSNVFGETAGYSR